MGDWAIGALGGIKEVKKMFAADFGSKQTVHHSSVELEQHPSNAEGGNRMPNWTFQESSIDIELRGLFWTNTGNG